MVVDGPPNERGLLASAPAMLRLESRMADSCVILLHDADRDEERRTLEQWLQQRPSLQLQQLHCEMGLVRLQVAA